MANAVFHGDAPGRAPNAVAGAASWAPPPLRSRAGGIILGARPFPVGQPIRRNPVVVDGQSQADTDFCD